MILTNLRLENFKKYRSYEIEFGEGLIGIIGKNGSGKSTLFEAILFALYGEAKKRGNKDILRNADASTKEAVVVELQFDYEDKQYKIVREFRGKAMSANAKLYKNGELTTSGAKEVTNAIVSLTKMSKDAFMHTLFASQKELTSLSTLKNEDRKKMIRKLLGLEKIDFVEKELIERSRELKRAINAFAEVLLSEEDVKTKLTLIKESKTQKQTQEKEVAQKTVELKNLKTKELEVKTELQVFTKTKEKKQKLLSNIELVRNSILSQSKNQDKLTKELGVLETRAKELKDLDGVKKEYEALHVSLKEQENLKNITIKKEGLEKEQTALRTQYTKAKADIKILEDESKDYEKLQKLNQENEALHVELKSKLKKEQEEQKQLQSELFAEQRIVSDTKAKISKIQSLGRESNCPTCTRALLEEYDNVLDSLNQILQNTQSQKIDKLKEKLETLEKLVLNLEKQKTEVEKALHVNSSKLSVILSKQKDLEKAKEHFSKVSEQGKLNKQELEKLSIYSYEEALHVKIQKSFNALKIKYELVLSLEVQLKREQGVKDELALTRTTIEALHVEVKNKESELEKTLYNEPKHKTKQTLYDDIQKQKEKQYEDINTLEKTIARCKGEIKTLNYSLESNQKQLKKVQTKKDNLKDYEKIKQSLSDFKTRLNAKVAPRISAIASQMFASITKGKYQHIEVNNDFDFFIYD